MVLAANGPAAAAGENAIPVVVELFTSEACSSCPPADAPLTKLSEQRVVNGAEVFVLCEHVDYFNHLGWTAPTVKVARPAAYLRSSPYQIFALCSLLL
jgi:hypothetical protein